MICDDTSNATGTNPVRFDFERDTFAFRNELVWEYRLDEQTGRMATLRAEPPPTFAHRCFVMVRTVRQFLWHTHFVPGLPRPDERECSKLLAAVVRRNPRRASTPKDRIRIPGFQGLRELSGTCEALLKQVTGRAWESYVLRSHWRMVFPFSRQHQAREAESLLTALAAGRCPIVHVVRFPQLTINHGLLLFAAEPAGQTVLFRAYDPNVPEAPTRLSYDRGKRIFELPRNHYWAGGRVDVFEIYHGWF